MIYDAPLNASRCSNPQLSILNTVACTAPAVAGVVLGMNVVCNPTNQYMLRLVELRARSHLRLSSRESNVGPTSLTFYTKLWAILGVGVVLLPFPAAAIPHIIAGEWVRGFQLLTVLLLASLFNVLLTFQRWVACIDGHAHWWRRQVEAAIASPTPADRASDDLQHKLSHLHGVLRQPFVTLNHYSTMIALLATFSLVGIVSALLEISPVKTCPWSPNTALGIGSK